MNEEELLRKAGRVEKELYQKAKAQGTFYTVMEAAEIVHERHPDVQLPRAYNAVARASAPDRATIKVADRKGRDKLLDLESFYAWLPTYMPQEQGG